MGAICNLQIGQCWHVKKGLANTNSSTESHIAVCIFKKGAGCGLARAFLSRFRWETKEEEPWNLYF
ncbi:hypothetical protein GCM10011391_15810 [Pullulanibacillus camelliae]|uniref:Uncharacterized protein n=1 Tax=Pullulanibacillus camelliae TaxID=1707096 RepID=A0A8J2YGT8_9BACL|nr:hypothetical protein GCM10011391_15810 [Pullulanibacillus camelliae]